MRLLSATVLQVVDGRVRSPQCVPGGIKRLLVKCVDETWWWWFLVVRSTEGFTEKDWIPAIDHRPSIFPGDW